MSKNRSIKPKLLIMVGRNPKNMRGGTSTWVLNIDEFFQRDYGVDYLILPNWALNITFVPDRLKALLHAFLLLLFRFNNWDVYMSHSPELSYVATLFSSKVIHVAHGNTNPVQNPTFKFGKLFYGLYEYFIKTVEKKARLLYTVGEERPGYIQLNQPINHNVSPKKPEEKNGFIYAGRLEKVKNINFIIDAYNVLPYAVKNKNTLRIFGRGSEHSILKKQIATLGLSKQVILMGHINNDDLISEINNSKILLLASMFEGFPMVVAEALTVGTPIVSTDVGAISYAVKNNENGFLTTIEDGIKLYAEKILIVLKHFEAFSKKALKSATMFDAESVYRKINNDITQKFKL